MSNPTPIRSLKGKNTLKNSGSSWFSSYATYNVWLGNHIPLRKIAWHFVKCDKQLPRGSVTAMTTMVPQHTTELCESNLLVQRSSAVARKCCQVQSSQWVYLPLGNGTTTLLKWIMSSNVSMSTLSMHSINAQIESKCKLATMLLDNTWWEHLGVSPTLWYCKFVKKFPKVSKFSWFCEDLPSAYSIACPCAS